MLTDEFKTMLKEVMLADGTPEILEEMKSICDAEWRRLLDIEAERAGVRKEPPWDEKRVRPRWSMWNSIGCFLGNPDWIRREIEQRDWTEKQREEEKTKREIESKRRELAALEKVMMPSLAVKDDNPRGILR